MTDLAGTPCPSCGTALTLFTEGPGYVGPPRYWCPNLTCDHLSLPEPLHPAPWQWVDGHWDVDYLIDANRRPLIDAAHSTGAIHIKTPRVRALTEAAPELDALVRSRMGKWPCSFCRDLPDKPAEVTVHAPSCPAVELITRIDERSKGRGR